MKFSRCLFLVVFLCLILGCSAKPEINVTLIGEKTALEEQILGNYKSIGNDVWLIASVRSEDQDKKKVPLSPGQKAAIEAYQSREFNKDEIDELKQQGIAGENSHGYLEIISKNKLEADAQESDYIEKLVEGENKDRKVIMTRIISASQNLSEGDFDKVEEVFADMMRKEAKKGEWIQLSDGKWIQKE